MKKGDIIAIRPLTDDEQICPFHDCIGEAICEVIGVYKNYISITVLPHVNHKGLMSKPYNMSISKHYIGGYFHVETL